MRLRVGHQHSQFLPILARFMYYYSLFWGPGVISTINEPWGAFTFRSSTLAVLADSEPLRGLLLTILGPKQISIVVEPQGALTCRSSTLTDLADSGPFHGLSHIVLGSRSDIHGCQTPRCAYVSVISTHSFGRFWPVSWTITHCFGAPE